MRLTQTFNCLTLPRVAVLCALLAAGCHDSGPALPNLPPVDADTPVPLPAAVAPLPLGAASLSPDHQAELTIQYIQRLPEIDYVWHSSNPTVEGWPAAGQVVTWRAHVKSWFPVPVTVHYAWRLDGQRVAGGTLTLPANAVATADYAWPWTFERHALTFVIDSRNEVAEEDEANDTLTVVTNALSLGLWVEQGFYDFFRAWQYKLSGAHSTSFEDWAQRQVYFYNELLRTAVYPETPGGVTDRIRLDRIHVVPDGSIQYAFLPDANDRTVDLMWGLRAADADGPQYDPRFVEMNNQFYYSGFLQHELGHARGMVDVYGYDVYDGLPGHSVDLTVNGHPLVGSAWMPSTSVIFNGHSGQRVSVADTGLMATDWLRLDRVSAMGWSLMTGRRAVAGNYNAPENIGWWISDRLPARTHVVIADQDNRRLQRATVLLYRPRVIWEEGMVPYGRHFGPDPDSTMTTSDSGTVVLGPDVFDPEQAVRVADGVLLFEVHRGSERGFAFLSVSRLNYEYAAGHTGEATLVLHVTMR